MKQIKKERKIYDIFYEAVDGTAFISEEECRKYEESARIIMWPRFSKLVIATSNEYDLFGVGSDECTVYVIKVSSQKDVDTVLHYYTLVDNWLISTEDKGASIINKLSKQLEAALSSNGIIYIGKNYEDDLYLIDSHIGIMERLSNVQITSNTR